MRPLRILSGKNLEEINEFLGELQDGDKYKSRLKALEDQKKEINALIEVYGKVKEIEKLLGTTIDAQKKADKLEKDAVSERDKARDEAAKMRADADIFASQKRNEANAKFSEREKAVQDAEADLGRRESALARSLSDLEQRENRADAAMKTAKSLTDRYTEAVASLKKAIEDTAKAL